MDPLILLKGLIVGFAMAVPIGPIGILCIRKTLAEGHARGLVVGLGAATADALFSALAAFGLTFVSDAIASQQFWLRLVGGGALLVLGVQTYRAHRVDPKAGVVDQGLVSSYASSFLLALTNPLTIVAFIAVFAAVGLGDRLSMPSASVLVVGVFSGSTLWFVALGYVATLFRKRLNTGGLRWVNRISGVLIMASGIGAVVSVL